MFQHTVGFYLSSKDYFFFSFSWMVLFISSFVMTYQDDRRDEATKALILKQLLQIGFDDSIEHSDGAFSEFSIFFQFRKFYV